MMDGDMLQHTRKLLEPMLAKSNLGDSRTNSVEADALTNKLPTIGSTVDLQPVLYSVV